MNKTSTLGTQTGNGANFCLYPRPLKTMQERHEERIRFLEGYFVGYGEDFTKETYEKHKREYIALQGYFPYNYELSEIFQQKKVVLARGGDNPLNLLANASEKKTPLRAETPFQEASMNQHSEDHKNIFSFKL